MKLLRSRSLVPTPLAVLALLVCVAAVIWLRAGEGASPHPPTTSHASAILRPTTPGQTASSEDTAASIPAPAPIAPSTNTPSATRGCAPRAASSAARAARGFPDSYLGFLYRRQSGACVGPITPALARQLASGRARVTPAEQQLTVRVSALIVSRTGGEATMRAGALPPLIVSFQLTQTARGWFIKSASIH
ncbi:MAG: hypothetical protein M3Z95_04065 [Actinomycetota bacterium]|nr:hypothetical protein [Actinomycetota bacterium]